MRWLASLLLLGSLLLSIAFAEPIPPRQGDAVVRRERVFGRNNAAVGGGNAQLRDDVKLGRAGAQRATADEVDATRNYVSRLACPWRRSGLRRVPSSNVAGRVSGGVRIQRSRRLRPPPESHSGRYTAAPARWIRAVSRLRRC